VLFGETLITHELVKQLQDLNEVIALSALLKEEKIKGKILQRLREIAFPLQKLKMFAYPEEVAKELDQPTIGEYE
jgi:uncharacterized protein YfeS